MIRLLRGNLTKQYKRNHRIPINKKRTKMNKIFLIVQREYLTRVRKKSFIFTTLLLPILILGIMVGSVFLAKRSQEAIKVAVVDTNNQFTAAELDSISSKMYQFKKETTDSVTIATSFEQKGYTAYCIVPKLEQGATNKLTIYSNSSKGQMTSDIISQQMNTLWNNKKLVLLGIDPVKQMQYDKGKLSVDIKNNNDKNADGKLAGKLAYFLGILIYMVILIYGSQVMTSVMEEKTSRVAEVIVSSVKPFQLMFGKLVGVGAVALTQFLLWIAFILIIYNVMKATGNETGAMGSAVGDLQNTFSGINLPTILVSFILYFIGGFFFYASIYAAIGSAVSGDLRDAQQLAFPVTMLVIFSLFIAQLTSNDPSSSLARWASMVPICSPFVMMSRIPYGVPGTVPWWELILSLVILFGSTVLVAYGSAKIYRTGILMYGKKVTFKELLKWIRLK